MGLWWGDRRPERELSVGKLEEEGWVEAYAGGDAVWDCGT